MKSLAVAAVLLLPLSTWAEDIVVKEVVLKEAFATNTVRNGKVIESSKLPAGTIAKVVRVESNTVWFVNDSKTNQIPISATDYSNRVQAVVAKELAEREAKKLATREQARALREEIEQNNARKREWFNKHKLLGGEVAQVFTNGLLVKVDRIYPMGRSDSEPIEKRTVLLVGSSKNLAGGVRIMFYAVSKGNYSYVKEDGVTTTIEKWAAISPPDFGVLTAPEMQSPTNTDTNATSPPR